MERGGAKLFSLGSRDRTPGNGSNAESREVQARYKETFVYQEGGQTLEQAF